MRSAPWPVSRIFSSVDLGSVEEEGSPLVNRGFSAYAPGSVFKLVTAAALLEEGMGDTAFTCVGSLNAGGMPVPLHQQHRPRRAGPDGGAGKVLQLLLYQRRPGLGLPKGAFHGL